MQQNHSHRFIGPAVRTAQKALNISWINSNVSGIRNEMKKCIIPSQKAYPKETIVWQKWKQ